MEKMTTPESLLYQPYRALGLVCNEIPFVVRYVPFKNLYYITTAVGNYFHTYADDKMKLIMVGKPHKKPITYLTGFQKFIFTASGEYIYAWKRGAEHTHTFGPFFGKVTYMMPFGDYLLAVSDDNTLHTWKISTCELYCSVEFPKSFAITCLMHPLTYVNKILIGSTQGSIFLWNIRTNKLIYTFNFDSAVNVLEESYVIDVVAIGLENGRIIVHDIKLDKTIVEFRQEWGSVTSLGFRRDNVPILVSGSKLGHLAIWDLERKQIMSEIRYAHRAPITSLSFLENEPMMVTASADNNLKKWIFDMPDGGARLYMKCDGHSSPPLVARFHGQLGNSILTGGEDSTVRLFSTEDDILNRNLGRAVYNKKASKRKGLAYDHLTLPPIINFTSQMNQEHPWDDVGAMHKNFSTITTWSTKKHSMGEYKLRHKRFDERQYSKVCATCIEVSACGNFILAGFDSGHIDKYNMQSGIYRGSLGKSVAHSAAVKGVVTNICNMSASVVSAGKNGDIKWWNLKTNAFCYELDIGTPVLRMLLNRNNNQIACALQDNSISIIHLKHRILSRRLIGHMDRIVDFSFSSNSKWLISTSEDCTIRTWDLPTGRMIDWFKVPIAATSLSMSPKDEYLCTTHVGLLGVYLWCNKSCFQLLKLSSSEACHEPRVLPIPGTVCEIIESDELADDPEDMEIDIKDYQSPGQISNCHTITQPISRFENLLRADVIRKRNKPKSAPSVPLEIPDFVPTIPGLEFKFDIKQKDSVEDIDKEIVQPNNEYSQFGKFLEKCEFIEATNILIGLTRPSSVEKEIQNLHFEYGGSMELMENFIKMNLYNLNSKINVNCTAMYWRLFCKLHVDTIINNNELYNFLTEMSMSTSQINSDKLIFAFGNSSYIQNNRVKR